MTPWGEVPVEELSVGGFVTAHSGSARAIVWVGMGRSEVTPKNETMRPVIVRKNALARGVPWRDLRLTPRHALFFDTLLVPVEKLINGRTIEWDLEARAVEFYHVELETHDILIADGAPAESYQDEGNRDKFRNYDQRIPNIKPSPRCAPLKSFGPTFDRINEHLLKRAGFDMPDFAAPSATHVEIVKTEYPVDSPQSDEPDAT